MKLALEVFELLWVGISFLLTTGSAARANARRMRNLRIEAARIRRLIPDYAFPDPLPRGYHRLEAPTGRHRMRRAHGV